MSSEGGGGRHNNSNGRTNRSSHGRGPTRTHDDRSSQNHGGGSRGGRSHGNVGPSGSSSQTPTSGLAPEIPFGVYGQPYMPYMPYQAPWAACGVADWQPASPYPQTPPGIGSYYGSSDQSGFMLQVSAPPLAAHPNQMNNHAPMGSFPSPSDDSSTFLSGMLAADVADRPPPFSFRPAETDDRAAFMGPMSGAFPASAGRGPMMAGFGQHHSVDSGPTAPASQGCVVPMPIPDFAMPRRTPGHMGPASSSSSGFGGSAGMLDGERFLFGHDDQPTMNQPPGHFKGGKGGGKSKRTDRFRHEVPPPQLPPGRGATRHEAGRPERRSDRRPPPQVPAPPRRGEEIDEDARLMELLQWAANSGHDDLDLERARRCLEETNWNVQRALTRICRQPPRRMRSVESSEGSASSGADHANGTDNLRLQQQEWDSVVSVGVEEARRRRVRRGLGAMRLPPGHPAAAFLSDREALVGAMLAHGDHDEDALRFLMHSFAGAREDDAQLRDAMRRSAAEAYSGGFGAAPVDEADLAKSTRTTVFQDGDEVGQCAICLCDFQVGDSLRTLECSHGFHMACVDQWLVGSSARCPVCKHEVRGGDK